MPRVLAACTGNLAFNELCQLALKMRSVPQSKAGEKDAATSSCPVDDNLTRVLFPTIILLFLISALYKEEAPHLRGEKEEEKKKSAQRILSNFSKSLIDF